MRRTAAIVIAAALSLWAAGAAAQERPATLQTLVSQFERMVFDEAKPSSPWTSFAKWQSPVHAILIDAERDARERVRGLFAEFEALTGIEFVLSEADSAANIKIFFSDRQWYRTAAQDSFEGANNILCFTSSTLDRNGALVHATVVIPDDLRSGTSAGCLAHELMHALGFAGHPGRQIASALRNGRNDGRLTLNDRILIRALYDDALVPGLPREDFVATARTIIEHLLSELAGVTDPMYVLGRRRPMNSWRALPDGSV